jgi:hypothetical protein
MALRGASYREILAHYYRGARLEAVAGGEEPAAGGAGPGGAGAYIRP